MKAGISKAKEEGKYRGRVADMQKHELIRTLRVTHGKSLRETARLAGVSKMTVIRVCRDSGSGEAGSLNPSHDPSP
jgi:DNA invertase Pin-like site-specific DNA recombinase